MGWRQRYVTLRRAGVGQVALARTWIAVHGDQRVQKGLNLRPGDLVVDVGAYQGYFTSFVRQSYQATVIAVEPIPEFAAALAEKFAGDAEVEILSCALGGEAGHLVLQIADDGSSAWVSGESSVEVPLCDVAEVLGDQNVALLKLNAEGAEFDVLERLQETDQIRQVNSVLVQFHSFAPQARDRRSRIRSRLRLTHRCTLNVPWVWEMWHRH